MLDQEKLTTTTPSNSFIQNPSVQVVKDILNFTQTAEYKKEVKSTESKAIESIPTEAWVSIEDDETLNVVINSSSMFKTHWSNFTTIAEEIRARSYDKEQKRIEKEEKKLQKEKKESFTNEDVVNDFYNWVANMTSAKPDEYLVYLENHEKGTLITTKGMYRKVGKPPRRHGNADSSERYNALMDDISNSARIEIQKVCDRGFQNDVEVKTPYSNLMDIVDGEISFFSYKLPYKHESDGRDLIKIDFLSTTKPKDNKSIGELCPNRGGIPHRITEVLGKDDINTQLAKPYLDLIEEMLLHDEKQIKVFHAFHASAFQFPIARKAAKMSLFLCGGHNIGKSTVDTLIRACLGQDSFTPVNSITSEYTNNGILMAVFDDTWGKIGDKGDFHQMTKALQSGLGETIRDNEKYVQTTSVLRSYAYKFNNNTLPHMAFIDDRSVFLDVVKNQDSKTIERFKELNARVYECMEDEDFLQAITKFYLEYKVPDAIYSRGVTRDLLGGQTKCATNSFLRSTLSNHNNNTKLSSKIMLDYLEAAKSDIINGVKPEDLIRHIYVDYYTPTRQKHHKTLPTDGTKTMRVDLARLLALRVNEKNTPFLISSFCLLNTPDGEHRLFIKFDDAVDLEKFYNAKFSNENDYLILDLNLGATDPRTVDLVNHPRAIDTTLNTSNAGYLEWNEMLFLDVVNGKSKPSETIEIDV